MNILIYAHPAILSDGAGFNMGWTYLLKQIFLPLTQIKKDVQIKFITGKRNLQYFEGDFNSDKFKLYLIDEWQLHRHLSQCNISPQFLTEAIYHQQLDSEAIAVYLDYLLKHITLDDYTPDIVISFSIDSSFFKGRWANTLTLTLEQGLFRGFLAPRTIFFDDAGIHRYSSLNKITNETFAKKINPEQVKLKTEIVEGLQQDIVAISPLKYHDYHNKFDKLCLLPLQVTPSYTFYQQTDYKNQVDYALDILSAIPDDVGVIVTEYKGWGSIFDTNTGIKSLSFFKDKPNFIYPPALNFVEAPSWYASIVADGIWSISSNVGWLSVFFNKPLGTSPSTQFSHIADYTAVPDFVRGLNTPVSHDALATWLLFHYYIPDALYENPTWLYEYLQTRLNLAHKPVIERFPLLASDEQMAEYYHHPVTHAPTYHLYSGELQHHIVQAIVPSCVNYTFTSLFKPTLAPALSLTSYLMNDTRQIEGELHLGSNVVTDFIRFQLSQFSTITTVLDETVDLIVLNGEGSLHSNREHIYALFDSCETLKAQGKTVYLTNTIWQNNLNELTTRLNHFDIVSVRENNSSKNILPFVNNVRIVPDMTFEGFDIATIASWCEKTLKPKAEQPLTGLVIDSVFENVSSTLLNYATFHGMPFFYMGIATHHLNQSFEKMYLAYDTLYPRLLDSAQTLQSFDYGITGRFHGLILLLSLRIIPFCIASDTFEIEGLLEDIGIKDKVLLPNSWLELGNHEKYHIIQTKLKQWQDEDWDKVANYMAQAKYKISQLFEDMRLISGTQPALRPEVLKLIAQRQWLELNVPLKPIPIKENATANNGVSLILDTEVNFRYGWSVHEPWGRWAIGLHSGIRLFLEYETTEFITLKFHPYLNTLLPNKKIYFFINRELVLSKYFDNSDLVEIKLPLKQYLQKSQRYIDLHFYSSAVSSPNLVDSSNGDNRALNFMLAEVTLQYCSQ